MTKKDADPDRAATTPLTLVALIRQRFSLRPDTDYEWTMQQVRADAEFGSGTLWALVFAILIASVGLNVNSTAVVIGAMLISPLMGPIVGAGFGLATNDWPLLRKGVSNLLLAALVGLVASAAYFAISPLAEAQSELLARTRPTLYDVLIALFGGGAGAVAVSRKGNKGNVIPGVAIATALMPPLCTAGFGIAQRNPGFVFGALHLFLINALFICLATIGFVRLMHFRRVLELDPTHLMRTRAVLVLLTLSVAVPSVYTAWTVVQEAHFKRDARRFIAENLNSPVRAPLNVDLRYGRKGSTITVTLVGERLSDEEEQLLKDKLPSYRLARTRLVLNQPTSSQVSVAQLSDAVREGVLKDLYERNQATLQARDDRIQMLENEVVRLRSADYPVDAVTRELAPLYPALVSIGVAREGRASATPADTTRPVVAVASWRKLPSVAERKRVQAFLAARLGVASLRLVNDVVR